MTNDQVRTFLVTCAAVLGKGAPQACESVSWCAWTTFTRLSEDAGYWTSGMPGADELADDAVKDGGTWGQPFAYRDIAHLIVPRTFYWEKYSNTGFEQGVREQDIDTLSEALARRGVEHRCTPLVLELKRY